MLQVHKLLFKNYELTLFFLIFGAGPNYLKITIRIKKHNTIKVCSNNESIKSAQVTVYSFPFMGD